MELSAPRMITRIRIDIDNLTRAGGIAGLAVLVAGSFGPWLRSGDRLRSSFELFQVADRLGFLGDGTLRWLPTAWVWIPVLSAVALALHIADRRRLALALTAAVAIAGLVVAAGVIASPLPAEWGCVAGVTGSSLAIASVLVAGRFPRSTSPTSRTPQE